MGVGEHTEHSQVLTPLKAQRSFQVAEDDDDVLTKIPHGLTAKRNRRRSYHNGASATTFTLSPLRAPLTAPRASMLNSRSVATLEMTKRSLTSQLSTMRDGKENDSPLRSKAMSPIEMDDLGINQLRRFGRASQKRRSSSIVDAEEINVTKVQKIEEFLAETEGNDKVSMISNRLGVDQEDDAYEGEEAEEEYEEAQDEELSRIELAILDSPETANSSFLPTEDDRVQLEEHEFEVEENNIHLVDDSMFQNMNNSITDIARFASISPLKDTPKPSLTPAKSNDYATTIDFEAVSVSPRKKPTHLVSPNNKPYFTIKQVHEIQADFKSEVDNLKNNLQGKSSLVIDLNSEIGDLKSGIYRLEDEIKSLSLEKKQLNTANSLLEAESDIFKDNVSSLERTISDRDDEIERHKVVISKFKERLQELNAILSSRQVEIEELKTQLGSKSRAINTLNKRAADYEKQAQLLSLSVREQQEKTETAETKISQSETQTMELKSELHKRDVAYSALEQEFADTQVDLKELQSQRDELQAKIQSDSKKLNRAEALHMEQVERANDLESQVRSLEIETDNETALLEAHILQLNEAIATQGNQLNLKSVVVSALQSGVNTLKSSLTKATEDLKTKTVELHHTNGALDDAENLLEVKSAEVAELIIELKELRQVNEVNFQRGQEYKHEQQALDSLISDLRANVEKKDKEIHGMREDIQKQETDHLTELEAFHAELSNVQSMVSNKSNELFKLKDEKEQIQRKYDLLKYEHDTMKEEVGDNERRISTLKSKLHEYKEHAHNLENLVKTLEDEKAELEKDTDKRLQQLAEDLYIQYSKKHEQKVQVLKKGYEGKWQAKVFKAELESERLRSEVEGLRAQLEGEKMEKNEIIKLWDNFKEAESTGPEN